MLTDCTFPAGPRPILLLFSSRPQKEPNANWHLTFCLSVADVRKFFTSIHYISVTQPFFALIKFFFLCWHHLVAFIHIITH